MSCDSERERSAKIKHGEFLIAMFTEKPVTNNRKETSLVDFLMFLAMLAIVVVMILAGGFKNAWGETCEASYYTLASCHKEGTSGITASGEPLKDTGEYTCASRTLPFGTRVRIKLGKREIVARVNDRGPNRKLWNKGRKLDLNLSAAKALQMVKMGVAVVSYEVI